MDSILTSIKKLLGIESEYTQFDPDIIMAINTVLGILTQIGVGPAEGFNIEDNEATWSDYLGDKYSNLQMIKNYMYMKVRLLFDPPQSSALTDVINEQIKELEYRIYITVDPIGGFQCE